MTRRIVVLALPFLAACATAGSAGGTPAEDASATVAAIVPSTLEPSEWRFVLIDGTKPVADDAKLTIYADRIGANVGCNGMGGDLKIEGDKFVIGPLVSTKMWCDGVMNQEMLVQTLLSGSPTWQLNGDKLILTSGKHSAELEPAAK